MNQAVRACPPDGLEPVDDIDASSAYDTPPTADPGLCPKCGGKLTDPAGLGWCSHCGYCRSIAEEETAAAATAAPEEPAKPSALGAAEFAQTVRLMPKWAWPLIGGVLFIVLACIAGNAALPELCLARAAWATGQLAVSGVALAAAQLWMIALIGEKQEGIGAKDVFLPGRVWRCAIRDLPWTRKPIWLGAWSLTGLVCSVALLGGFTYWLEVLKEAREAEKLRLAAARADTPAQKANKEPEKEADKGKTAAPDGGAAAKPAAPTGPTTVECAVIGYKTDGLGTLKGLVVATTSGDKLKYVGIVTEGMSPEQRKELMPKLTKLRRSEPIIPGLQVSGVFWVKPGVFCDVEHKGDGKKTELEEATVKGVRD